MKYRLFFMFFVFLSMALWAGTSAKVTAWDGRMLTIDKGASHGVKTGMMGTAIRIDKDTLTNKVDMMNFGRFVVREVFQDSATIYIDSLESGIDTDSISGITDVTFDNPLIPTLQNQNTLSSARIDKRRILELIRDKEFGQAGEGILEIEQNGSHDTEFDLIKEGYNWLIEDKFTYKDYIRYKSKNPHPVVLKRLEEKLYKLGDDPNLPPERYLDERYLITQNERKYYEITFKEKNNRIMIFIPSLKLFVDKYEVSCRQAQDGGITVNPIVFSQEDIKSYPAGCDNYPAMVTYDQAENYCKNTHLRLPTEKEWEFIAGGNNIYEFGWGFEKIDDRGIYHANYESMDDGYKFIAPITSFSSFYSNCGALNMSGNVSEWVKGAVNKGGGFMSELEDLKIEKQSTIPMFVGFRCVMEAGK